MKNYLMVMFGILISVLFISCTCTKSNNSDTKITSFSFDKELKIYEKVFNVNNTSSVNLYDKSLLWVSIYSKNIDDAIYYKLENKQINGECVNFGVIKIMAFLPGMFDCTYQFQINIKENKVKIKLYDIRIITKHYNNPIEAYYLFDDGTQRTDNNSNSVKTTLDIMIYNIFKSFELLVYEEINENW